MFWSVMLSLMLLEIDDAGFLICSERVMGHSDLLQIRFRFIG